MKQIVSNLRASLFLRVFQFLSSFFVVAYVIKVVGIEQWGILTLSLSLITALSFLQSGFSAGVSRDLSGYYYKGEKSNYSNLMNNVIVLSLGIVFLIVIINVVFYLFFNNTFILFNDDNILVYILIATSVLFQVLQIPFMASFQSINKIDTIEYLNIISILFRVVLVFSLFLLVGSILVYAFILFLENLLRLISMIILLRNEDGLLSFKGFTLKVKKEEIISILKVNSFIIINGLNYLILVQLTVVSLNTFYSLEMIGYFGIALQINSLIRSAAGLLSKSMAPIFNILRAKNKLDELREIYHFSHQLFNFIGGSLLIFMVLIGNKLYMSMINIQTYNLLFLLNNFSWFILFGVLSIPITNLLVTIDKIKKPALISLFLTLVYLASINLYDFGESAYFMLPMLLGISYFLSYSVKIYEGFIFLFDKSFLYKEVGWSLLYFMALTVFFYFFSLENIKIFPNYSFYIIIQVMKWLIIMLILTPFFFRTKKIKKIKKILRSF